MLLNCNKPQPMRVRDLFPIQKLFPLKQDKALFSSKAILTLFQFNKFSEHIMAIVNISSPVSMSSEPEMEECSYIDGYVWRKEYLAEGTYLYLVALACVNSISSVPTVLLNALVIFAVATRRPIRTNSNILLACLAGNDLLAGLVVQPIAVAVDLKRILGAGPFCPLEKTYSGTVLVFAVSSLFHLVLISIDRYIAIKKPLRYQDIVTKRRITTAVLLSWAITVFAAIPEIILASIDRKTNIYSTFYNVTGITIGIIAFLLIVTIVFSYGYIFSETRRQKKRFQTEQLTQEEVKRIKKDNKAANTLAIILAALVLTFLPSVITTIFLTFSDNIAEPRVMSVLTRWNDTLLLLGSLCNPIIYCWRTKKLRRAFLEILHLRQPENRAPEIEMQVVERHYRPQVPPTTSEALSRAVVRREPVLLSFCHLKAEEIVPISETD